MTTRREFLKALAVFAAANAIPLPVMEAAAKKLSVEIPVGTIVPFFTEASIINAIYTGEEFIKLDGSQIPRLLYPGLFAVIGTAWGDGDGETTFNLPDMRGRVIK